MKRFLIAAAVMALIPIAVTADINVTSYTQTLVDPESGVVTIQWDDGSGGAVADATLMYGHVSGSYPVTIAAGTTGTFTFRPINIGMTGGVYYFRVSNVTDGTWSNEHRLFVNKGLGLGYSMVAMKPKVFSPEKGGLNIEYMAESENSSTVRVSIKAFNMEGKHIATIIEGQLRPVGVLSTDVWDGKDKLGYKAKNGRYIIQIEIEDITGRQQHIETVILVK